MTRSTKQKCQRACCILLAVFASVSCNTKPPADSVCSSEPLPASTGVTTGQGAIFVSSSTDGYFYVFDGCKKQIGSNPFNRALALKPGQYELRINKSVHPATVQSSSLTRCTSSTLLVPGATDEYYYVF